MRIRAQEFSPRKFSFHDDPVLVLEEFWSSEERQAFREGMRSVSWKGLQDMPAVSKAFPNCGNWMKAEIAAEQGQMFLEKVTLPCIADYIESFPNITQRHINFNYYSYGEGDCLSTHDDTDEAYSAEPQPLRRIALVTYFHEEWNPDWGGELIIYDSKQRKGHPVLEVKQCITPAPGSLVLFTVPRFHRVCRVDTLAGTQKRLSIAGWFMTEHHP